jgi:hypothetical protein
MSIIPRNQVILELNITDLDKGVNYYFISSSRRCSESTTDSAIVNSLILPPRHDADDQIL